MLDLLSQLVEKSLVAYDEPDGRESAAHALAHPTARRYRLLETVRQYSRDRLRESGQSETVRRRHRDWCLGLSERAEQELLGKHQAAWLARLEHEHDNLRVALEWGLEDEPASALRLATALGRFWEVGGYFGEGREALERGLDRGADGPGELSARAMRWAGWLAFCQGEYERAKELLKESLEACRAMGDRQGIADVLNTLGRATWAQGDYESARALLEETLAISREIGDPRATASSLNNLGYAAWAQGDLDAARDLQQECLAICQEIGYRREICYALQGIGDVAWARSEYGRARALFAESLSIRKEIGDKEGIALGLERLAEACLGLALPPSGPHPADIAAPGPRAAAERAARLFGAAEALREAIGFRLPPAYRAHYEQNLISLREQFPEAAGADGVSRGPDARLAAAWAAGRAMSLEDAIRYALEEVADG